MQISLAELLRVQLPRINHLNPEPFPMPTAEKVIDALGTGRRKTSVARVRIRAGNGKLTINKRELDDFFKVQQDRKAVLAPLEHAGVQSSVDVRILVHGG